MKHVTRFSDSSLYDEVCTVCGATDATIAGLPDRLSGPCLGAGPSISAAYQRACPPITGRIITAHEVAEADAMRAALVDRLLWTAEDAMNSEYAEATFPAPMRARSAALATVLALLLAPEVTR